MAHTLSDFLPDQAEVDALRRAQGFQKSGTPTPIAKKERAKSKADRDKAFRDAVWARDKGKSRATGRKLERASIDWDRCGEVDHAYQRSLCPERIYDVTNGILLSKTENRLRKVVCSGAPEFKRFDYTGPDDRSLLQTFTWRDKDGHITKTRIG